MSIAQTRKLVLQSHLALGDVVMLTAAVRDLHRLCPGRFLTDVRTAFPDLWAHNPYLTPLDPLDPTVETLGCDTPLIHRSGQVPCHYLYAFLDFLNRRLGLDLGPTEFRGDIHLSETERSAPSPIRELAGADAPYWLVCAGGKHDITIKWWAAERYQSVIDHFRGRIQFVQVGHIGHCHPRLEGVMDLRGRTNLRQLIRLVHNADGVLCGVTALMHLAAGSPEAPGTSRSSSLCRHRRWPRTPALGGLPGTPVPPHHWRPASAARTAAVGRRARKPWATALLKINSIAAASTWWVLFPTAWT